MTPAAQSRLWLTRVRLATYSASTEPATAASHETTTSGMSYEISIGRWNASMATKCMLQIPLPMATLPPSNQASRARPRAAATRAASVSAVYDAPIAISIESATSGAA
jgi:hypothetical protein